MSNPALATRLVIPFEELRMTDVDVVGGKNASLGEMISQLAATGVRVPGGFAEIDAHLDGMAEPVDRARKPGRYRQAEAVLDASRTPSCTSPVSRCVHRPAGR